MFRRTRRVRRFSNQPTGTRPGGNMRERTQMMRNKRSRSPIANQISIRSKFGQFRQKWGI